MFAQLQYETYYISQVILINDWLSLTLNLSYMQEEGEK